MNMKTVYPAIFTKIKKGYAVSIPDFPIDTQGKDLGEAIDMARDAIGILCIDMEDEDRALPLATASENVPHEDNEIVSLIDVDLTEYRIKNERRTVRRNVSLPAWLNREAEKAGINASAVFQEALKAHLHL
jgi:predicted RNase H-like HicB family nuclease